MIKRHLPFVLAVLCACVALGLVCGRQSFADGSGSGSASAVIVSTDPGSGSGSALTPAPATALHDPTVAPAAALDDLKDAKSKGWPFLVLVLLIFVTKVASYAGGRFAPLGRFLARGKNAMIIAGAGTVLAAAFNVLANGGNWYAVAVAAATSGFALISSHAPETAVTKHEAA